MTKATLKQLKSQLKTIDDKLYANNFLDGGMNKAAADKPLNDEKSKIQAIIDAGDYAEENPYQYWSDALKGEFGPIHDGDAQCGYYAFPKIKGKPNADTPEKRTDKPAKPVAFWFVDGEIVGCIGADKVECKPENIWDWVCMKPISYEDYNKWCDEGIEPEIVKSKAKPEKKPLPKEEAAPEPVAMKTAAPAKTETPQDKPATIGHNNPPEPIEDMKAQLKAENITIKELLGDGITTQDQAEKLGQAGNRVAKIKTSAEKTRKEKKQPFIDAGKEVDEAYNSVKSICEDVIKDLRVSIDAWKESERVRLEAIEKERVRKANEAEAKRVAEEKAKAEAEQKAAQAEADRKAKEEAEMRGATDAELETVKAEEVEIEEVKEAKVHREKKVDVAVGKTASGGKAFNTSRTVTSAKIIDKEALINALKDRVLFVEFLQQQANAAARTGTALPGTEILKEKK